MTFVVAAQLPPALARVLPDSGCDAVAVREIGLRDATDSEIWHYAIQREAAIITKDEDFAERCLYSQNQPVVTCAKRRKSIDFVGISIFQARSTARRFPTYRGQIRNAKNI